MECEASTRVNRSPGDPLFHVTADMLVGMGNYATIEIEMTFPAPFLWETMRCARMALQFVPSEKMQPQYVTIKQSDRESFSSFIDKLTDSLMSEPCLTPESKEIMLKALMVENANAKTQSILMQLPRSANLADMIEKVNQSGVDASAAMTGRAVEQSMHASMESVTTALTAALRPLGIKERVELRGLCYRCGNRGHIRRQCRERVWCENYKNASHATLICKRGLGNWRKSALCPSSKTQIPVQANYGQPPEGVWDQTWLPQ